jgi:hypothetical protein
MGDSVLWAVALGSGAFGLLLLTVAGAVALYWKINAPGSRGVASAAGDVADTGKTPPPADFSNAQPTITGSPWLWIKAWLFALLHAGTVSLVLGGITFFEDITKASDEIQRTGTVTFPKQLLPGTLSTSTSRKRLSQPSGDSSETEDVKGEELDQPGAARWEVVDLVNEVGVEGG